MHNNEDLHFLRWWSSLLEISAHTHTHTRVCVYVFCLHFKQSELPGDEKLRVLSPPKLLTTESYFSPRYSRQEAEDKTLAEGQRTQKSFRQFLVSER